MHRGWQRTAKNTHAFILCFYAYRSELSSCILYLLLIDELTIYLIVKLNTYLFIHSSIYSLLARGGMTVTSG